MIQIIKIVAISVLVHSLAFAASSTTKVFEKYDQKIYKPQKTGLKDLVVEFRIDRLKEILNQRLIFGKIDDLYFKLFWSFPNKKIVEVYGMPKGFREAKDELLRLAEAEINYLLPRDLTEEFEGFNLSFMSKDRSQVLAIDPSYRSPASEVTLSFDREGVLKKLRRVSPMGTEVSSLKFKKLNRKWSVDELVISSRKGLQKVETTKKFLHKKSKEFWLLDKILVSTVHRLEKINRSRLNNLERKMETKITFSNYKINEGAGLKYIRKMKQSE